MKLTEFIYVGLAVCSKDSLGTKAIPEGWKLSGNEFRDGHYLNLLDILLRMVQDANCSLLKKHEYNTAFPHCRLFNRLKSQGVIPDCFYVEEGMFIVSFNDEYEQSKAAFQVAKFVSRVVDG